MAFSHRSENLPQPDVAPVPVPKSPAEFDIHPVVLTKRQPDARETECSVKVLECAGQNSGSDGNTKKPEAATLEDLINSLNQFASMDSSQSPSSVDEYATDVIDDILTPPEVGVESRATDQHVVSDLNNLSMDERSLSSDSDNNCVPETTIDNENDGNLLSPATFPSNEESSSSALPTDDIDQTNSCHKTESVSYDESLIQSKGSDKQLSDNVTFADDVEDFVSKKVNGDLVVSLSSEEPHSPSTEGSREDESKPRPCNDSTGDKEVLESSSQPISQQAEESDVTGLKSPEDNDKDVALTPVNRSDSGEIESHSLPFIREDANAGADEIISNNNKGTNDRMKRFKDSLQCLKSKVVTGFEDKARQDTPIVPDLPDLKHEDPKDKGEEPDTNFTLEDTNNERSNTVTNDSDFAPTKESVSDIMQEMKFLSSGDDSVFEAGTELDKNPESQSMATKNVQEDILTGSKTSADNIDFEELETDSKKSSQSVNDDASKNDVSVFDTGTELDKNSESQSMATKNVQEDILTGSKTSADNIDFEELETDSKKSSPSINDDASRNDVSVFETSTELDKNSESQSLATKNVQEDILTGSKTSADNIDFEELETDSKKSSPSINDDASKNDLSVFETGTELDKNSESQSLATKNVQEDILTGSKTSADNIDFEELETDSKKSSQSVNDDASKNDVSDQLNTIVKENITDEDETTKLIPHNNVHRNGSSSSSFYVLSENDDMSNTEMKNGSDERPKSGIGSTLSKLFERLPFQRQNFDKGKSSRPSSEHLTPSPGQPIKFYSMADDHGGDRGLSLSPEQIDFHELLVFGERLQQHDVGAEGGQTNEAFEDDIETINADDLLQLLLNLTEQLKTVKSMPEINDSDDTDKTVRVIHSELLENLRLLQKKFIVNPEPEIDSIDDEVDDFPTVNVSDGAMRLARLGDGVIFDPEQPMITSKRSTNDDDNLSLEFFVPGSTKTFRLHRKTFIVFVLKYSIFMFSFLFWFCSLSVAGFGGWMLAQEDAIVIDDFTDVFLDPYALLCLMGGTIFIVAFFGCVGALRENICLLRIFHLAMTFVLVFEILVGAIVFLFFTLPEFRQAVKVGPEEVLKRAVINYFDDEGMQKWIDNLQKEFHCCGTSLTDDGYLDWEENIYFNCSSPSMYRCSVPLSCCIFEKGDFIDYMCGADIMRREESYVRRYINTKGCMKSLGEWLAANTTIIAYITAGIVIPQILSIVSARYFNSMLQPYTILQDGGEDEPEPEPEHLEGGDQASNVGDPDGEPGLSEELNTIHGAANARTSWRRLSEQSKALVQSHLENTIFSNRHAEES